MTFSKQELRFLSSKSLSLISKSDYHSKSLTISYNILSLFEKIKDSRKIDLNCSKSVLGVFSPLKDEPYWPLAFERFLGVTAFPKIGEQAIGLTFVKASFDELTMSKEFGVAILTPADLSARAAVEPDCLLIPGLAFSRTGGRLGRGKGFYDRYLESFKGIKIGICFKEVLGQEIPQDKHDEVMDYMVTDSEILEL